jgi:UDP-2-acetamido-2,6-beta-L-arabino-hexul-4-ose reductase
MDIANEKLEKHEDKRGWLIEILRKDRISEDIALIHFSVSKPGAVRGNHYHNRKVEWFCVVRGLAQLLLEDMSSGKKSYTVLSGEEPQLVKILPGFGHAIKNIGEDNMYLMIAVNEVFNPDDSDTYPRKIV